LISGKGETSSRLPGPFSLFLPGSCPNNRNHCRDEGTGGTLLWEAAKHVGEPFGARAGGNPIFLVMFGMRFVERFKQALVYELLTDGTVSGRECKR
jgi:hypothetical protein